MEKQFLIAFVGSVGSGKTFIAKRIAHELGAVYLRSDDLRVALRKRGKPFSNVRPIARRMMIEALEKGKSVVSDFDAVLARRRRELKDAAFRYGARLVVIEVRTPEKMIVERLRRHRYTERDLFRNAQEAIRVYFVRKKLHQKLLRPRPDFVINNAQPLGPQIKHLLRKLK